MDVAPRPAIGVERSQLLARFRRVRRLTEWVCEPLTIEDQVIQTSIECSPVKWQLAHSTWFYETFILKPFAKRYREYHPTFNFLFNSYYNTIGERSARDVRGLMSRPTLSEVQRYRAYVDLAMEEFIEFASEEAWASAESIITLGTHHEEQHIELIVTDVKTVLAMNPMEPVYRPREIRRTDIERLRWQDFNGGLVEIGADGASFAFDNEGPRHRAFLQPFALADRLITNRAFIDFIDDHGYSEPALWLSDGWSQAQANGWDAPLYWKKIEGKWWNMTLQGMRPVELSEPVTHISHFEADAFATWSDVRLATEFEWELAAQGLSASGNLLESGNFHPVALDTQDHGLAQMFGDCWEWTRSAYLPYPRYAVQSGALGEYNGKFMSNQMVLRGGSCATAAEHIRASYRNFFPPESRWQFSGIRLAKDL